MALMSSKYFFLLFDNKKSFIDIKKHTDILENVWECDDSWDERFKSKKLPKT
jgi:hypothetical protein